MSEIRIEGNEITSNGERFFRFDSPEEARQALVDADFQELGDGRWVSSGLGFEQLY